MKGFNMIVPKKMMFYGLRNIVHIPQYQKMTKQQQFALQVVGTVLPFRTNNYIVEELIDWENIPNDPIYQLTFMQEGMLTKQNFETISKLLLSESSPELIKKEAERIRYELNPHPAGQLTANIPVEDSEVIEGVQHKYKETALVFPSSGQTCHAYCTFCFRWAQFVGMNDLKFATDESQRFQEYIKNHKEITDILFTGGDPMVMGADKLKVYIEPLLGNGFEHIQSIRIGTKSISYWPYKYVTDKEADDILRLFDKIISSGKHLAIMGHFNHWKELTTDVSKEAVKRIRNTGAEIRSQSPLIKHINDNSETWARMWKEQVRLGIIPYYFFIERDTGASQYFAIPLAKAYDIFRNAYIKVSGLSRTVRGPSMSATPGKVAIEGVSEINGEKVFMLNFLQGRNADWVRKPFFAKYSETATWLNDLDPALGEDKFFFEDELNEILTDKREKVNNALENKVNAA